jgi:hypothetical protein
MRQASIGRKEETAPLIPGSANWEAKAFEAMNEYARRRT